MSEGLSQRCVGGGVERGAARIPGRRLTHTSQNVETQAALCLNVGGRYQVSALEELREQVPDLGTGLPREPAPKCPWIHVWGRWSWDAGQQMEGSMRQQENP